MECLVSNLDSLSLLAIVVIHIWLWYRLSGWLHLTEYLASSIQIAQCSAYALTSLSYHLESFLPQNKISHCHEVAWVVLLNVNEHTFIIGFNSFVSRPKFIWLFEVFTHLHCNFRLNLSFHLRLWCLLIEKILGLSKH